MSLSINDRIKVRVSLQIILAGFLLGIIFIGLSNGFSNFYPFINGALVGVTVGTIISFFELWLFAKSSRKLRFVTLLIIRILIYALVISISIFIIVSVSRMNRFGLTFSETMESADFQEYLIRGNFSVAVFYSIMFAFSINFTRMINRKMGQGVLISFITGTFYEPVTQDRIVMFLGLKNINDISNSLEQVQFFDFLNEYFFDVTEPITFHQGIIYEYVEDQMVITWRPEKGISNVNCIRCYFSILELLEKEKKKYSKKYKIKPSPVASLHYGTLVRAEIGKIKTQIVFQGDVMNTTARLLGKCEELNTQLIMSDQMLSKVIVPAAYEIKQLGANKLKGKFSEIHINTIEEKIAGHA